MAKTISTNGEKKLRVGVILIGCFEILIAIVQIIFSQHGVKDLASSGIITLFAVLLVIGAIMVIYELQNFDRKIMKVLFMQRNRFLVLLWICKSILGCVLAVGIAIYMSLIMVGFSGSLTASLTFVAIIGVAIGKFTEILKILTIQ